MAVDWKQKYEAEQAKVKKLVTAWKAQQVEVERYCDNLTQANQQLEQECLELHFSYKTMAEMISNLVELSQGLTAGYARNVACHAQVLGISLGLEKSEIQDLYLAGLLHDIGKCGLPPEVLQAARSHSTQEQVYVLKQVPWMSMMALLPIGRLQTAAQIILKHTERLDGSGYPSGLQAANIPLPARLLGVVADYHRIRNGCYFLDTVEPEAAIQYLKTHKQTAYDPRCVDGLLQLLQLEANQTTRSELRIELARLEPGMVLSRPVLTEQGLMLLPKHAELTETSIQSLQHFCEQKQLELVVFIKRGVFKPLPAPPMAALPNFEPPLTA